QGHQGAVPGARRLRGRADPAAHAAAEAAWLHQPVPRRVPGGEPGDPAGAVPRGRHRHGRGPRRQGRGAQEPARQGARFRRGEREARRHGPEVLRLGGAEDRGGWRVRHHRVSLFLRGTAAQNTVHRGAPSSYPVVASGPVRRPRRSRGTGTGHDNLGPVPGPPGGKQVNSFVRALRTPELRAKIFFTLGLIAVYRLGVYIPTPGVDATDVMRCADQAASAGGSDVLGMVNMFSGGALLQLSIFSLGVMPYITASIIVQLLRVVIPRFEALHKEGASGTAK